MGPEPQSSSIDLTVITVSYNTRKLLADCLESVLAGIERSRLVGQVCVVDNASADGSAEMVHTSFPDVYLVAHDQNLGFAGGNNLALQKLTTREPDNAMLEVSIAALKCVLEAESGLATAEPASA